VEDSGVGSGVAVGVGVAVGSGVAVAVAVAGSDVAVGSAVGVCRSAPPPKQPAISGVSRASTPRRCMASRPTYQVIIPPARLTLVRRFGRISPRTNV
jgi:hypothetical protein